MELEEWLKKYDVKKMALDDLNNYLKNYREDDEEGFNEYFKGIDFGKAEYEFDSVAYFIADSSDWKHKYIGATVKLLSDGVYFATYDVFYGLDGEGEDDYLRRR